MDSPDGAPLVALVVHESQVSRDERNEYHGITAEREAWGRGTNRVIEECRQYGIEPPAFREESGMLVVTFNAQIGPAAPAQPE